MSVPCVGPSLSFPIAELLLSPPLTESVSNSVGVVGSSAIYCYPSIFCPTYPFQRSHPTRVTSSEAITGELSTELDTQPHFANSFHTRLRQCVLSRNLPAGHPRAQKIATVVRGRRSASTRSRTVNTGQKFTSEDVTVFVGTQQRFTSR